MIELKVLAVEKINAAQKVKNALLKETELLETLQELGAQIKQCYEKGGKVLFCGNGGSAADAQHLAAELSGRFYLDRKPLHAEALHVNTSYLTATANDYSFGQVYSRLIEAQGKKGDILIGLSTSGNSENVIKALEKAKMKGMTTAGFTGAFNGPMEEYCDFLIKIPSQDTPRIQEGHILLGHILCEWVEGALFG
ncbi:MAG: D-sedoheptulose 7-phosphate isomerase [Chitinophagales bacterium]